MNTLFIGGIGTSELIVIAIVLLIFFGGEKLPSLMRGAGKGIKEFKEAMNEPVEKSQQSESTESKENTQK